MHMPDSLSGKGNSLLDTFLKLSRAPSDAADSRSSGSEAVAAQNEERPKGRTQM